MSLGHIAKIVKEIETLKTAFGVSRLVMLTGANLRGYTQDMLDDAIVLERLKKALPAILTPDEIDEFEKRLGLPLR